MRLRCFPLVALQLLLLSITTLQLSAADAKTRAPGARVDLRSEMPADAHVLALGDAAPDFRLPGIDGKTYSLADFKAAPVLMVVFLSNHCPYSHAAETRLIPLAKEFAARGLAVVAINPNDPESVDVTELGYTQYSDSFEDMKLYAKEQGFPFPYLYDGDTQATAKAYGCLATPHVFLFDRERKLRYAGRVDDSRFADVATVTSFDARHAVVALLEGKPVPTPLTTVVGCATKWKGGRATATAKTDERNETPVTLENVDAAAVAELARNASKRFRLINVWATWCAPCVQEFPELVALSRRFANRDFELVTISLDDPKQAARAKSFLEKQHAVPSRRLQRLLGSEGRATTNFIYTAASTDELVKALDPQWPGPLPHTVLIAPGGEIVYRHNGPIDPAEVRAVILKHLGAYYTPGAKR